MVYSALDDIRLLQLLQEEDEEAFAELYTRYWKSIFSQALYYTKSAEAAEDIVQDVFLKLWSNRESLQQVQEFKPYLFVTARNRIISSLRNKVFHVYLDENETIEEQTLVPERQFSYKESVALLNKAVGLLPPQQQKAYQLSRNEGLRYEDIAREMGISRLTVRTHITKAIAFIRNYLAENGNHPALLMLLLLLKKN